MIIMELISREDVLALYKREQPHLATNVYEFGEMLKDIPVVEERKTGKWIYLLDGSGNVECTECGVEQPVDSYYCPWCGAKMEGAYGNIFSKTEQS